jgi:hypothetical protein
LSLFGSHNDLVPGEVESLDEKRDFRSPAAVTELCGGAYALKPWLARRWRTSLVKREARRRPMAQGTPA